MGKIEVDYRDVFARTVDALAGNGALLVATSEDGRPNAMTIGWGTIGSVWARPVFVVLVRPSRYTYSLMEQSADFTVNVLPTEMAEALAFCGEASGRRHDKFAERGLVAVASRKVKAPVIEQAVIQYECRTIQKTDLVPSALDAGILRRFYPKGDFHRVYFGEIVAVHAEEAFTKSG